MQKHSKRNLVTPEERHTHTRSTNLLVFNVFYAYFLRYTFFNNAVYNDNQQQNNKPKLPKKTLKRMFGSASKDVFVSIF